MPVQQRLGLARIGQTLRHIAWAARHHLIDLLVIHRVGVIEAGGQGPLVGVVTDGDVRRAMLRGASLDAKVDEVVKVDGVAAAHDYHTGVEGSYDAALASLSEARAAGLEGDLAAAAGLLGPDVLERHDEKGQTLADWLRRYSQPGSIPFAAWVADRMHVPMQYVRKKPKGYGRNARIEGAMTEGQRVLLVEDLTTDGGSKLSFVDAIRDTGASCAHTA